MHWLYLYLMEFHTLINLTNLFKNLSCGVVIYNFIQFLKVIPVTKRKKADQMLHNVVSDLVLHCLLMSSKMDARLILVIN